jgi:tetratricopeptide (TPR) repeat protein
MGQILKFPVEAAKLGYKRVRKRTRPEDPDQLQLSFSVPSARILSFKPSLSSFEQALVLDDCGDSHAAELYARAIENQECVADAYCNLGIIESQKGSTAKAFDCFTTALKLDPRHSEAHYNLANLYFEVNDFRLAQIHYELAAEVDPVFANAYYNLALIQSINNDFARAIDTLTKYQQLSSAEDARNAEELLHSFRKSLGAKSACVTAD